MEIIVEREDGTIEEGDSLEHLEPSRCRLVWVDLEKPSSQELEDVGEFFKVHPVVTRNWKQLSASPQLQEYDEALFIVWDFLRDNPKTDKLESVSVGIVIGSNFIITVCHDKVEEISRILEKFSKNPSFYKSNPVVILHTIMDSAVDAYFPLVEQITENIERETDQLISGSTGGELERLLALRHRNIAARRAVSSHRDITLKLLRRDLPAIQEELAVYFVDILDHLGSLLLEIDNNAEFVSSSLEIHQNAVSNKLNSTMKRLTTIATIFMPLTFITGIYGMNFEFMPELSWEYGYLATWLVIVAITVVMVIVAIKKDWF